MKATDVVVEAVASFGWCQRHLAIDLARYVYARMESLP
jgi:hypothetical protein